MGRVRTFIGIGVSETIRANAAALQQALVRSGADVNWVAAANLHVTLVFLGDVDDRELPGICRATAAIAAGEPAFTLRVAGVGAFPTSRRPRTVWAGVTDGSDALARLHGRLESTLEELVGYRREDRPYTAHLTLGRVKSEPAGQVLAQELTKHATWDGGQTLVTELAVYSSELRRDGPEYSILGRAPLAG